jgi:hypothetical protein
MRETAPRPAPRHPRHWPRLTWPSTARPGAPRRRGGRGAALAKPAPDVCRLVVRCLGTALEATVAIGDSATGAAPASAAAQLDSDRRPAHLSQFSKAVVNS